ncbi:MAG: flavin reductase, partial [bacterium]|nr:flavin reductase [bacterium]
RPQRYTKEFIDNNDTFTISFFSPKFKDALAILGKKSGRDGDKVKESGLTPLFLEGSTAFREASIIFLCRKLYQDPLKAKNFINKDLIKEFYPEKDYHTMYISEILCVAVHEK